MPSYSKPCLQLGGTAQDDLGGGCNPLNPPPRSAPAPPDPPLVFCSMSSSYIHWECHCSCTINFVAYYKQWTYKKLARSHSLNNSSNGITIGIETVPSGEQLQEEQLNVTALETSTSQNPSHYVGEAPPVYCETSEQSESEADHVEHAICCLAAQLHDEDNKLPLMYTHQNDHII